MVNARDQNFGDGNSDEFSTRNLLLLSVLSFVVYLSLSMALFYVFHDKGIDGAFGSDYSITKQLFIGVGAGCLGAFLIRVISSRSPVSEVLDDFYIYKIFKQVRLSSFNRAQLSVFAGTGEELLFRGAIQPLLGVWLTSLIFVAIHGYFSFKSSGHVLFGIVMFGLSLMLGFLFEYIGLVAAMSAHAVYDMIMLSSITDNEK
ncbi:MAG: CPBP family intramembrane glutamic endopeptidase [Balneolales bacterium]